MVAADGAGIAASFWEKLLRLQPWVGTIVGDERYDDRLHDPGRQGREATGTLYRETLRELTEYAAAPTGPPSDGADALTLQLIELYCRLEVDRLELRDDLLGAVNHLGGPQAWLTVLVQMQPADTPIRLARLLARLAAFRGYADAHAELIREAAAHALVQPRIVTERTIEQLERLIAAGADGPVSRAARVADDDARARVAAAVAEHVVPAYGVLLDVIRTDYLPHVRDEIGLVALPDGEQRYALAIRQWTALPIDAATLHQWGARGLEQLGDERLALVRHAGAADSIQAYRQRLAADPDNIPSSAEALLGRMREDVGRAWTAAGGVVGRLPVSECRIEALDPARAGDSLGYYNPPNPQTGLAGVFYMNTTNLPERLFSRYATITYHEAIPGHHLQLALEAESGSISPLRRFVGHRLAGAFTEGWGLYAERLADEIGLFRNEQERFGMLDSQAWRAARLVIDTGLHAFGWSRECAIATFVAETGFDEPTATVEVDRYIANPAQALAYRVGQAEIERLRAEASSALGRRFSLSRFHDALLGSGSVPLPVAVDAVRSSLGLDGRAL